MRVLILDGSRTEAEDTACLDLARRLTEGGHQVQHERLRDRKLGYCQGCFGCWVEHPGRCKTDDGHAEIGRAFIAADVAVLYGPVTFGGYSAALKKVLDRFLGLIMPFFQKYGDITRHTARYARHPRLVVVGVTDDPHGTDARTFRKLAMRNAVNLHAPRVDLRFIDRAPTGSARADLARCVIEPEAVAA
jgi:multimeric flavodoxin WrbA